MPPTPFSRLAGQHLEDHRDADMTLILVITDALVDRKVCDNELRGIHEAIGDVLDSTRPLVGYMERQDQAFRMIQLISNTGALTEHVEECMRSMAKDRMILPIDCANSEAARSHPDGLLATNRETRWT